MHIEQRLWTVGEGWRDLTPRLQQPAQWVMGFGAREVLADPAHFNALRADYPTAHLLLNSTSGEIFDTTVIDHALIVTAVHFEQTQLQTAAIHIQECTDSRDAGRRLGAMLTAPELAHVFVISDGLQVNGSELVLGLRESLPAGIPVTGGLAGDAARFGQTLVGLDAMPASGNLAAIGLYGTHIRVGHGSVGGWDTFGPERTITRAQANVLYELDNQSALALYKSYLADEAAGLPGTGLLFPLSIRVDGGEPIVRTILAVDEAAQSMTFAGDMPVGASARLMKANFDRLVEGAGDSAEQSLATLNGQADLAICISCVGRKLVLGQRIDEEVEAVRDILGNETIITGFYSYGEISPFTAAGLCELHNQTMTITTLQEV